MIRNVLLTIAKGHEKKGQFVANRKSWITNAVQQDNKNMGFNPRRARYKSIKGLNILNNEM